MDDDLRTFMNVLYENHSADYWAKEWKIHNVTQAGSTIQVIKILPTIAGSDREIIESLDKIN